MWKAASQWTRPAHMPFRGWHRSTSKRSTAAISTWWACRWHWCTGICDKVDAIGLARLQPNADCTLRKRSASDPRDALAAWRPEDVVAGDGWGEGGVDGFAFGPGEVHRDTAAGAEALDAAIGPGGGECRKKVDGAVVTLEEHLGDGGGASEV